MSEIVIYCPECRSEYREGFTTCSECKVPLVRRVDSETGDYLVPLAREGSFEFVAELLDRLEKQNIPYVVKAGTALQLLDSNAEADVLNPQPWEARIWVTHSAERLASDVLEKLTDELRFERGTKIAQRYLDSSDAEKGVNGREHR